MAKSLNEEVHSKIAALCASADKCAEENSYELAMECCQQAWELLPLPKHDWDAATWILSAIGDCWFRKRDFEKALQIFTESLKCPKALGNPFIHLRLGESHFELGNMKSAADELTRAYMGAGKEIFENEPPQYMELLRQVLKLPPGQTEL